MEREEPLPPRRPGRPKGSNKLVVAIAEAELRHELAGLRPRRKSGRGRSRRALRQCSMPSLP
jgi:hypothetical protein